MRSSSYPLREVVFISPSSSDAVFIYDVTSKMRSSSYPLRDVVFISLSSSDAVFI
ncbi:hypothetical protein SLEP1_g50390 [Rubroshorea leprosula]|uniref:Uncharacterized protein n=1 Tax=Rubroshorea leprosula TaxID=152421 RepID=A0AAV5M179_9ROSI|nr:hypothetical protein SLEP1_g50390 [Rubroshorea leprosula]